MTTTNLHLAFTGKGVGKRSLWIIISSVRPGRDRGRLAIASRPFGPTERIKTFREP